MLRNSMRRKAVVVKKNALVRAGVEMTTAEAGELLQGTAIAVLEIFSVFSFNSPFGGEPWSIRSDYESGDLGFDPLGLKPESAEEFKEMQTKELNNGRLAMVAIAGMIGQELATGSKLL